MNDWKQSQFYDDGHTEYETYIGKWHAQITEIVPPRGTTNKRDHWGYKISHPHGSYYSGHRFPWSARQAINFVVVVLALKAISKVLTGDADRKLWNEDDLDRV